MGLIKYVIIAGNLGTGKTTVCRHIQEAKNCTVFYETRDIILQQYYLEPQKYAFLNQLAYSLQYLEQAIAIDDSLGLVVQDRSIYDTHEVFSRLLTRKQWISPIEFGLLERVFRSAQKIANPSLLILLDASADVCLSRIKERGLKEEEIVSIGYLQELREMYLHWYAEFSLCPKLSIVTSNTCAAEVAFKVLEYSMQIG